MLTSILAVPEVGPVPVSPAAPRTIIAIKSRKIDELWIYTTCRWLMEAVQRAHAGTSRPPRCTRGDGEGAGEGMAMGATRRR